jgi:hypothetical protein
MRTPPIFFNLGELECFVRDSRTIDVERTTRSARVVTHVSVRSVRRLAIATLGETVKGGDPAAKRLQQRRARTAKELCDRYLTAVVKDLVLGKGGSPKNASSLYVDRGRINRHIMPPLGNARRASRRPLNKFIEDVATGKSAKVERTDKECGKSIVRGVSR